MTNAAFTPKSAASAIADGIETVESVSQKTGWPIIEDCVVPAPGTWHADDGNAEITVECATGQEAAQEYVDGGEWGETTRTDWIHVYAWRVGINEDGELVRVDNEKHRIELEPEAPSCVDGGDEHDWQAPYEIVGGIEENPGVSGNGGGVIMTEVCMRCGCGKTVNTWDTDMSNGEQGLTSVQYEPERFRDAIDKLQGE
jgi:hypothetical protein